MEPDDVSFESIEGSDDDALDPLASSTNDDFIRSGGDPDDDETTEDLEDE